MKELSRSWRGLPWIVKFLLSVFYGIYGSLSRVFRSGAKGNLIGLIIAILLLLFGGFFILWLIDLIFVIIGKDIWWID